MTSLLSADDLNDFIKPSVACIKPVEEKQRDHVELEIEEVEIEANGEVKKSGRKLERAQISLTDCLACSGCITSSEEVLVAQHSYKEFINFWNENKDFEYVLSLSQQVRASLSNAFDIDVKKMDIVLYKLFSEYFNFQYMVSVNLGRRIAYDAMFKEIENRDVSDKCVMTSICPGWMLYVEKTHKEILNKLSNVKSPQYITGKLIKEVLKKDETKVYNLAIMPCFDKKLEASRDDVVDCVITPRELISMIEEDERIDIDKIIEEVLNEKVDYGDFIRKISPSGWFEEGDCGWGDDLGDASGGYATNYLMKCQDKFGGEIVEIKGRNEDIVELQLVVDGEVRRRAGIINGFKNIQNLVRKLKGDKSKATRRTLVSRRRGRGGVTRDEEVPKREIDLTECNVVQVMACPGGCANGGGQIAVGEEGSSEEWLGQVLIRYRELPSETISNEKLLAWSHRHGLDTHVVSPTRVVSQQDNNLDEMADPTQLFSSW